MSDVRKMHTCMCSICNQMTIGGKKTLFLTRNLWGTRVTILLPGTHSPVETMQNLYNH